MPAHREYRLLPLLRCSVRLRDGEGAQIVVDEQSFLDGKQRSFA